MVDNEKRGSNSEHKVVALRRRYEAFSNLSASIKRSTRRKTLLTGVAFFIAEIKSTPRKSENKFQ